MEDFVEVGRLLRSVREDLGLREIALGKECFCWMFKNIGKISMISLSSESCDSARHRARACSQKGTSGVTHAGLALFWPSTWHQRRARGVNVTLHTIQPTI